MATKGSNPSMEAVRRIARERFGIDGRAVEITVWDEHGEPAAARVRYGMARIAGAAIYLVAVADSWIELLEQLQGGGRS